MKYFILLSSFFFLLTSCCSQKEVKEEKNNVGFVDLSTDGSGQETSMEEEETEEIISYEGEENDQTYTTTSDITEQPIDLIDHSSFDRLLKKYVTVDGIVDYAGIKNDKEDLDAYLAILSTTTPDDTWSSSDQFAYYMNAYNAMTIDLIIDNYPLKSIKDINDPWEQENWRLGDRKVSLEYIEHEILRKMNEPRIHFGINCASFSCPPLLNEAFTASKVNAQMEQLAIAFINDPKRNSITANRVEISKIFKWFSKDFKSDGSLIDYLNKYSKVKIDEDARVRYMEYNWQLNGK